MRTDATFSECRSYRYSLTRIWDETKPLVVFCGLNPSTADEAQDDPTIRREMGYARDWGMGGLLKVNAYAFRSTDPRGLWAQDDPIGPANFAHISTAAQGAHLFIAAWGVNIMPAWQDALCHALRGQSVVIHALKLTKHGFPSHPLYLPKGLKPRVWEGGVLV